jgi:[ribosomal protein S18]-alanine N-acetyltransferase
VPELRKYRHGDFDRLIEIDEACFVEGIAYSADEMRSFLSQSSALTLVATENGEIQGFIIADRFRQRRGSRFMGRIITIDVAPPSQHDGSGTLLLNAAETELRQTGCDYVSLEVAVDNEAALRFYKKQGYSVLKVLPRYYLDSIDGLLMGKKL